MVAGKLKNKKAFVSTLLLLFVPATMQAQKESPSISKYHLAYIQAEFKDGFYNGKYGE